MPRRITDHPDYYQGWNEISTFGSSISVVASLVFFYVIFDMLVFGKTGRRAPYAIKVLTQMQLSQLLVSKSHKKTSIIMAALAFADSTDQ